MFANNPEVKEMFNMDKQESGEQPKSISNDSISSSSKYR